MNAKTKIFKVMEKIKDKADISPEGAILDYRAGLETQLNAEDEIAILNKLAQEGVIEVVDNYSSEYV